ncbi:calmodulin [Mytilus galloprovincialis]|uniref:Calmodulin n=2 Tax=Mytilus galloprovincialis TaxID=29158 RepID=A0A8B6H5Q7_MYTGA|nr:calmodulin [Mytilus galloprovincialis]
MAGSLNKYVRFSKTMNSLTQVEIEYYRDAFKFFDRDKKGYITAEDFDKALRRMGNTIPTEEEVQNLLKEYDINGDGKVTFEEMVVMTVKRKQNEDEDPESRKLFDKFDSNKDGYLNREELVEVLAQLGPRLSSTDVEEILRDYDENHDGLIQFSEFEKMLIQ